jgi:adenylate cyclase
MIKRLQERRKFDEAASQMQTAIELGPDSWEVNKEAGRFYLTKRDLPAATRHYERAAELMDTDFHVWAMLSTCYHAQGDAAKVREAAKMMVAKSQAAIQQDPSNGAALGILAGYIGDTAEALKLLQSTMAMASESLIRIAENDPDLDSVRDDPRFRKLLANAKKRHGIKDEAEPAE